MKCMLGSNRSHANVLWLVGRRRIFKNFTWFRLLLAVASMMLRWLSKSLNSRVNKSETKVPTVTALYMGHTIWPRAPSIFHRALKSWPIRDFALIQMIVLELFDVLDFQLYQHCLFEIIFGVLTSFYDWISIHFSKIKIGFNHLK